MEELQNFISLTNEKRDIMEEMTIQKRPVNDFISSKKKELETLCQDGSFLAEVDGSSYLLSKNSAVKLTSSDFDMRNVRKNLLKLKDVDEDNFHKKLFENLLEKMKDSKPAIETFSIKPVKKQPEDALRSTQDMNSILRDYIIAQQKSKELLETFQTKKADLEKTLKSLEEKISQSLNSQMEVSVQNTPKSGHLVEPRNITKQISKKQFKEAFDQTLTEMGVGIGMQEFFERLDEFMNNLSGKINEYENKTTKIQLRKKL